MKQSGQVKWFNEKKGFGFIALDNGGDDVFIHYTGIAGTGHRTLQQGQKVTFQIEEKDGRYRATDVKVRDDEREKEYQQAQRTQR